MKGGSRAHLELRRDEIIRSLWTVYREMSDVIEEHEWDDLDLELWGKVTVHDAVQSRIGGPLPANVTVTEVKG